MGFTGYIILFSLLVAVVAILVAIWTRKTNTKLKLENIELEDEIDRLEDEAKRHLEYMATIEKFKKKHQDNRRLIEEAEDEDGVKGSFDIAVDPLEQLRKLRTERRASKN